MSRKDILTPWHPLPEVTLPLYIDALYDDIEGFRILLSGESKTSRTLIVRFENTFAYRNTNESYLLELWHATEKEKLGNAFYIIDNSSYIESFNRMSEHIYADWDIAHYAIYTVQDCVDILSTTPPTIHWLDKS